MATNSDVPHILTVEVEEYYQDRAFREVVPPAEWSALPTCVDRAVDRLLDLLERCDTRATFFVDDWVARNVSEVVPRIHAAGHEVASRGKAGARWSSRGNGATTLDHVTVAAVEARRRLEELAGCTIWGHRSAQRVEASSSEALCDRLRRTGFRYDSSVFANELPRTDSVSTWRSLPADEGGGFLELPRAETRLFGVSLGPLGGANFRQLPYDLTRRTLVRHAERDQPVVFSLHSWEVDRFQPELPGAPWPRFRHYAGLENTEPRLERLLSEFRFTSARDCLALDDTECAESDEAGTGEDALRRSAG